LLTTPIETNKYKENKKYGRCTDWFLQGVCIIRGKAWKAKNALKRIQRWFERSLDEAKRNRGYSNSVSLDCISFHQNYAS